MLDALYAPAQVKFTCKEIPHSGFFRGYFLFWLQDSSEDLPSRHDGWLLSLAGGIPTLPGPSHRHRQVWKRTEQPTQLNPAGLGVLGTGRDRTRQAIREEKQVWTENPGRLCTSCVLAFAIVQRMNTPMTTPSEQHTHTCTCLGDLAGWPKAQNILGT